LYKDEEERMGKLGVNLIGESCALEYLPLKEFKRVEWKHLIGDCTYCLWDSLQKKGLGPVG